jgi:Domain of unknown function (DUF1850)
VALADGDTTQVVARDASGEVVAALELPADGRFALEYVHSYYRAPAQERFAAASDGGFRLESIASRRAAVLDYYELEGRRVRDGGRLRLYPRQRRGYDRLPLIATSQGRRTLVAGDRRRPLYGDRARHLTIELERR